VFHIGPDQAPPPPVKGRFTLGSLMLVIALVAVCLGVLREVPGLGVILILVATPALARTLGAASHRKRVGRPMTAVEKVEAFVASVGVVTAIGVSALIAFVATCVPVGFVTLSASFEAGLILAVVVGLVAAVAVGVPMIRRLWPRRD
jgi:hypothetical protein